MRSFLFLALPKWWRCSLLLLLVGPAHAQVYYLNLSYSSFNVPERNVFVEAVVDGRPGQPPIGTVYQGLNNRTAAVLFRQGLVPEFTNWLQTNVPRRPTDRPIVLCFRQLRISEEMSGLVELARADLAADVYEHRPDGYHFLCSVADHISEKALESTYLHGNHLARLMRSCLGQIALAEKTVRPPAPARALNQLADDVPLRVLAAPILAQARPRRGVYYNFEQFLANRPDTTAQIRFDTIQARALNWEGTLQLQPHLQSAKGERIAPKQVWGLSDGNQAYIAYAKTFWPLFRQGVYFTFVGAAPRDMEAATKRAKQGAMTGGMLGAAMASSVDDGSAKPMVYALDMQTGQAGPQLRPGQPQQPDTAYVYVYRPLGGPPTPQRLLLDDRPVGQLLPGEFLELTWPYFGHPARLAVGTPAGPTVLLAPNTAVATYLKLEATGGRTPWRVMPAAQGEAEVDALEKHH